ncbi:cytochrome c [Hwanghaeella grinnelliae]|uniref:Cytochrome c n=1 Tax=Hwanghaeella grinnelliae TaxID=2500179 RepID=A0A437QTZ2_9PROT|nr:cytochrome c [Hwanghaeella grinnelliae]RVU37971.1 cytochrome c [Hwanghaeella grinnelliae]
MSFGFLRAAFFIVLLTAGSAAFAHSTATGIVKERMESMKAIGKATKSIVAMMQGKQDYDPTAISAAAASIKEHGGEGLLAKFPKDSLDPPSEALPAIWQDWVTFKTLNEDLRREAALLETVAANGPEGFGTVVTYTDDRAQPAGPVATRLLKTCKSCHDKFREED